MRERGREGGREGGREKGREGGRERREGIKESVGEARRRRRVEGVHILYLHVQCNMHQKSVMRWLCFKRMERSYF